MKNTPHINLLNDIGFGKTLLMPGDPLRAKYIAQNFLENAVLVNNVRGIQGYTGYYKGIKVSVMASGMGMPSIGIYSHELFSTFGVENIIRVGSAGGLREDVKLRDIIVGMGANTDSNYASQYGLKGTVAPICSFELLKICDECAEKLGLNIKVGSLYSTDVFYDYDSDCNKKWAEAGSLAVEMEAAALYLNAMILRKKALAICTVSDLPFTGEGCSAEERQNSFTDMMRLALEIAVKADE